MRIFARADATIISVARKINPGDPPVFPFHALGYAATFDFDEETNAALADDLGLSTEAYRVSGGVLTKNAVPVVVAPPGRYLQDRQQIEQNAGQLDTWLAKRDGGTNLTAAEVQAALGFLFRAIRFLLKRVR